MWHESMLLTADDPGYPIVSDANYSARGKVRPQFAPRPQRGSWG